MQIEALYEVYKQFPHVQTDSRKLRAGELFFALKGPNFNGNQFAEAALIAGAAAVIVDEETGLQSDKIWRCTDVLQTLQELALFHRRQFSIPFIAITGSNGKTTSKELVHAVLSRKFRTCTTQGNLNNHIGIPLTILSVKPDAEIAVIEMGANHQKEIAAYCTYTEPTHGIITNCGKAHLEGFGGIEGVRKGKGELYDYIREHHGTIFRMNDYDYLLEMSRGINNTVTYGTREAQITGQAIDGELLQVQFTGGTALNTLQTQLVGNYNLPNVLLAVAVGVHFGVPETDIQQAIESYTPSNSRSQLVIRGTNKIILDAYNANPTSMRAAIENMAGLPDSNKVLMIGGMMEMGAASHDEHKAIIQLIGQYSWNDVVLVGGDFGAIPHNYHFFPDSAAAAYWLRSHPMEHCTFLIKGSRSMRMEQVLDAFPA